MEERQVIMNKQLYQMYYRKLNRSTAVRRFFAKIVNKFKQPDRLEEAFEFVYN